MVETLLPDITDFSTDLEDANVTDIPKSQPQPEPVPLQRQEEPNPFDAYDQQTPLAITQQNVFDQFDSQDQQQTQAPSFQLEKPRTGPDNWFVRDFKAADDEQKGRSILRKIGEIGEGFADTQQYKEFVKGIVPGTASVGGTAIVGVEPFIQDALYKKLNLMDRIDKGEFIAPHEFTYDANTFPPVASYANKTPEERKKLRGVIENMLSKPFEERIFAKTGVGVQQWANELEWAKAKPGYEQAVGRLLGSGVGSVFAGIGISTVAGGPAATTMFFGASGSGEAVQRAIKFSEAEKAAGRPGLTDQQIAIAGLSGVAPGTTDTVPIEFMLGRFFRLPPAISGPLARFIGRVGGQVLLEGSQEAFQEFLQNWIAQSQYNPKQSLTENIVPAGGLGGGVGGITAVGHELLKSFAGRYGVKVKTKTGIPTSQEELSAASEAIDKAQEQQAKQAEEAAKQQQAPTLSPEAQDAFRQSPPPEPAPTQPSIETPATELQIGSQANVVSAEDQSLITDQPLTVRDIVDDPEHGKYVFFEESPTGVPIEQVQPVAAEVGLEAQQQPASVEQEAARTAATAISDQLTDADIQRIIQGDQQALAQAVSRNLSEEQVAQVQQLIAAQRPDIASQFRNLIARSQFPADARIADQFSGFTKDVAQVASEVQRAQPEQAGQVIQNAIGKLSQKYGIDQKIAQDIYGAVASQTQGLPVSDIVRGVSDVVRQRLGRLGIELPNIDVPSEVAAQEPSLEQQTLRNLFANLINSKTPQSQWADRLGVSEQELAPLIDEAVQKGWLTRTAEGKLRRAPKTARTGHLAPMIVKDAVPDIIPGEGFVAKTDAALNRWDAIKATVMKVAKRILPDDVYVDFVDNIEIAELKKEDQLLAIREKAAFDAWFGDSKVVDENGQPLVVYNGAMRGDRIDEKGFFDPKRATSGPMPFFSDNPTIASNYAVGKADTSMADFESTAQYFTVSPKDVGNTRGRTPYTVEQSWHYLTAEQKKTILDRAKRVGYQNIDESSGPFTLHPEGVDASLSSSHFDYLMQTSARGNPLIALREMWHDGGDLIGNEAELATIYKLAGYPHPISQKTAPWYEAKAVFPVYLAIKNPIVTSDDQTIAGIIPELEAAFKRDRTRKKEFGADAWDKNTRFTPKEWVAQLKEDHAAGNNSYVWTSIPDKVTDVFKSLGYDGIIDTGGKGGGIGHNVYVPFYPTQVKSAIGNIGTYNPADPRISYALRTGQTEGQKPATVRQEGITNEPATSGVTTGREGGVSVEKQSTAGVPSITGEGIAPSASGNLRTGLPVDPLARIVRQFSASLDENGNVIVGRQSREGRAARKGAKGNVAQRVGTTESFKVGSRLGSVKAEVLEDQDIREGNLARLTYKLDGETDASPLAELNIVQRYDGAWEVDSVTVNAPRRGIGTQLYNAVEKDLGVRMSPSGVLSPDGIAFWQKRSPASVQWHVQTPTFRPYYFSPAKIESEINRVRKEIRDISFGIGNKRKFPADLKQQLLDGYRAELRQLKDMWGKLPEEARAAKESMFSLRGFYSPAIRAAEQITQQKGTGEQFYKQITKIPGVRKDEIEWMGLQEFLSDKKSITKDEVLAFMRAHQIQLDEKILGDNNINLSNDFVLSDSSEEKLNQAVGLTNDELPPGTNVRVWKYASNQYTYFIAQDANGRFHVYDIEDDYIADATNLSQAQHIAAGYRSNQDQDTRFESFKVPGGTNYKELLIRAPFLEGKYTSKHFQDQEIVHIRTDDRVASNGEKVLFVNEVQSDLHQSGRISGYIDDSRTPAERLKSAIETGQVDKGIGKAYLRALERGTSVDQLLREATYEERNQVGKILAPTIPQAPFKGDLWLELALKRTLLYAAENGYDAVSWARSDQIASAVGGDAKALSVQYDQKIPRFFEKYTKKWGGKVEVTDSSSLDLVEDMDELVAGLSPMQKFELEVSRRHGGSYEKAIAEIKGFEKIGRLSLLAKEKLQYAEAQIAKGIENVGIPDGLAQPILRITPQMRASVLEGQPLAVRPGQTQPEALGRTDPYNQIISLSMRAIEAEAAAKGTSTAREAIRVFRHEVGEFFKANEFFTPKEWKLLQETARKKGWVETTGVRQAYEQLYKQGMTDAELSDVLTKEAIFEQYSEFHLGNKSFEKPVKTLFQRFKDYLTRIVNWMKGQGFDTWEDVFTKIDQGEFKQRYEQAFGTPQEATTAPQTGIANVVRAGQLQDAPGFTPSLPADQTVIGLSEHITALREALGMTVRQGRLDPNAKRAARAAGGELGGHFNRETGVTRLAVSNSIDDLAHEGGHHLESLYKGELDALKQRHAAELIPLATPGPDALSEGFADFFRRYVTNPTVAQQKAPNFYKNFEGFLDRKSPDTLSRLQALQQAYTDFLRGDPTQVKIANQTVLKRRESQFTRFLGDAERHGVRDTLADRLHVMYFNMVASSHGWWLATKKALDLIALNTGKRVDIKAVDNPNKLLRRISHTNAWAMQDLKRGIAMPSRPEGGGVSMHDVLTTAFGGGEKSQWNEEATKDFGDYLISRSAINRYIRHAPQLRNDVIQFIQAHPNELGHMMQRLPVNTASTIENAPTLEPLNYHLQSLLQHEQRSPQYRQAAEMYYQFNKDVVQFLHEKGLLSDEHYQALQEDTDYAPFQRDRSDIELASGSRPSRRGGGDAATANKYDVFKAFKGSTRDIINPIQSTVQFVYEMRLRAALNDTLVAMDKLAKAAGPGGGAIFERLPAREAVGYTVDIQEGLKKLARDAGLSETDTAYMLGNVEQFIGKNATATLFTQQLTKERGERIVWFYENGKPVPARLADGTLGRMMFEGFTGMGQRAPGWFLNIISLPATAVRFGVTNAIEFIGRNIFVDALTAPINSPYAKFGVTQISGSKEILSDGKYMELYNRYAGMMGGEMTAALTDQSIQRDIEALRVRGFKIRRPKTIREFLKFFAQTGEFSETATRVGIFKKAYESALADGLTPYEAGAEAAYASHDAMDFSRHGSKTEIIRRSTPFWNAGLIGTDRYARSLTAQGDHGSAIRTYLKYRDGEALTPSEKKDLKQAVRAWGWSTLILGGMSYLFYMLGEDDEDMDEIGDRLRATHWRVSVDGVLHLIPKDMRTFLDLPDDSDVVVRLPKPFEIAWFANAVERGLDAAKKGDPTAFRRYVSDLWEITHPPSGMPVLDIPYEIATGKSLFTGRPIIPQWDYDIERAEQYGPYTSETARRIGKLINVSPFYVDHVIRSVGASVARDAQTVIDFAAGKGPKPRIEEYPVARRFTYNTGRFSHSLEGFYNKMSDKEGINSWFWDLVSKDARSFNSARNTYRRFLKNNNDAAASDFYETLNDDQKVFAVLGAEFQKSRSKYRNLHPMINAEEGIRVIGSLMREVYDGELKVGKKQTPLQLNRQEMQYARNELGHIRKGFAQNALHIVGAPGWANMKMVDVDRRLETLKAGSPKVYDEMMRRLVKEKFIDFKTINKVWPEVKRRVLEKKKNASLGDLYQGRVHRTYSVPQEETAAPASNPFNQLELAQ